LGGAALSSNVSQAVEGILGYWLIVLGMATYLMLWPEDGRITKEDVRAIFDGSIFQRIADKVEKKRGKQTKQKKRW
jgi:hypothetical protein